MKNFIDINVATLSRAFVIKGISTRLEFWYFVLFTWLVDIAASAIDGFIPGDFVANIMTILFFVPSLTVAIRRMHDTDHSGWWLLLPIVNLYFLITPSKPGRWS